MEPRGPDGARDFYLALDFTAAAGATYTITLDDPVAPSPATLAILPVLKAGEGVFQTRLPTKTVLHAYRGAQPLFHAVFWRQNTI